MRITKRLRNLTKKTKTASLNGIEQPSKQNFLQKKETLEQILEKNILPFWYPQVIDWENGGYNLNHDLNGAFKGKTDKSLVAQARTLWFFSRLANRNYSETQYTEAANVGYQFLVERMWDPCFGGFFWEVDSSGIVAVKTDKHMYGQAFGLYALSEYARTSKNPSATQQARNLFELMEQYAHDKECGGYREFFQRNWEAPPEKSIGYLNAAPDIKLMNTHLHLLEAFISFYLLTGDDLVAKRLYELIYILSNTVVQKDLCACTEYYQQNWVHALEPRARRVSYGHDLENIWLLAKACQAIGISNHLLYDLYKEVFKYSLQYGFDQKNGGFYLAGPLHSPADQKEKIWWVQAEALISTLCMYQLTRKTMYFDCFCKTLNWILLHQIDWNHGDWFAEISINGKPAGDKAGPWKSPYHNGRSMLECIERLDSITGQKIVNI